MTTDSNECKPLTRESRHETPVYDPACPDGRRSGNGRHVRRDLQSLGRRQRRNPSAGKLPHDLDPPWILGGRRREGAGKGFHDVYTQPEAAAYYRQHGRFPDGAVLVKEIRTLQTGFKTTGPAQWAGENAVWFVMIKDDKRRFKNHPHWAEGWGWAMYEASNPALNTSKSFTETCQSCHIPARATDWVFVEGYPTLKP
jgi:hypothetical protein